MSVRCVSVGVGIVAAWMLCAVAPAFGISYVEHSSGLGQPGLEGGNTELEFGDVNGDGFPDIVSVGDHGNPGIGSGEHGIMVWFGHASGPWTFYQAGDLGYGGVALGDVNGDGLLDVGYGIHHNYSGTDLGNQILEVALGDGTGQSWTAWDDGLATAGEDWGMFGSDFADVDLDGDLDLGSISFGCCAGLHVYRNNGNGTWTHSWGFTGGNSNLEFCFGDVNGDGHPDFASSHDSGTVYLGNGAGGFTMGDGNLPSGPQRFGIALGDVNDDGRDDLSFRTSGGVYVYTWTGPGQWQNLSGSLTSVGSSKITQIADMNLDGHGDVVLQFLGSARVYAGDGAGTWTLASTITTDTACDYAAFRAGTDVDHNGYPDLALVQEEDCSPWVGGTNALRCFVEASAPAEAFIHPKYPRGGETWIAGSVRVIEWHGAVPPGASAPTITLELSRLGAAGPYGTLATGVPNSGRFQWTVPSTLPSSAECHLRLTLNTDPAAVALTPAPFEIVNPAPLATGDVNCDGVLNAFDIDPFVQALADAAGYAQAHPWCDLLQADVNGDGVVNAFDIDPFVELLSGD